MSIGWCVWAEMLREPCVGRWQREELFTVAPPCMHSSCKLVAAVNIALQVAFVPIGSQLYLESCRDNYSHKESNATFFRALGVSVKRGISVGEHTKTK